MKITFSDKLNVNCDAVVVTVTDSLKLGEHAEKINKEADNAIKKALKTRKFKGEKKELLSIVAPSGVKYNQILLVGLGKEKKISDIVSQEVGASVYVGLNSIKAENAAIIVEGVEDVDDIATNIAYGAVLRSYRFGKYKTKEKPESLPTLRVLDVIVDNRSKAESDFNKLQMIADGVFLSRDVVTEPPNKLYPESYAKIIKEELSGLGVKVTVLGAKQLEKLGMGALLGVGQGSIRESHVVVMEYNGSDPKNQPLAFVGKGVTFDTGGISIKPALGMEDMKYDMGGSAAVVGLLKALAGRKAKANAVGIVGLVENMPGHNAQRPSDVVTSMSGQTVEVLNTDAEGRLVLADILTYVQQKHNPQLIIDLATLTGAIVVALGEEYAGLFSNDDKLSKKLFKAGEKTDEKLWRFPLGSAYDKMLDSPIADMQNISAGRGAGSITAAQFLQRFIENDTPWAHLDIAGVAWTKKAKGVCPKGATGFGVRLLDKFVNDNYEE
ncbi:MAG: leucyl aminopeptidase [Alphaproteobacteria bacterium CG11_big_fil_rev_8_21_14_0_20_39_49]|nr:MAG: leucyl aminopeptidase [Alphaproteobacteria bacterium CG11_big_fil_rev_8_21_14_0_20_39_49]